MTPGNNTPDRCRCSLQRIGRSQGGDQPVSGSIKRRLVTLAATSTHTAVLPPQKLPWEGAALLPTEKLGVWRAIEGVEHASGRGGEPRGPSKSTPETTDHLKGTQLANHTTGQVVQQPNHFPHVDGVASIPRQLYYSCSFAPAGQPHFFAVGPTLPNLHLAPSLPNCPSTAAQRAVGGRSVGRVCRGLRHSRCQGAVAGFARYGPTRGFG